MWAFSSHLKTLFLLTLVLGAPSNLLAQYNAKSWIPTTRSLKVAIPNDLKEIPLISLGSYSVPIGFPIVGDQLLYTTKISINGGATVRELIEQIDNTPNVVTLIREFDVLIVSDVDQKRIDQLTTLAFDENHPAHDQAIEQLLKLSHPKIYPPLFWVMAHGIERNAQKIAKHLLRHHSNMMNQSPSFEHACNGFHRTLKSWKPTEQHAVANVLPEKILIPLSKKKQLPLFQSPSFQHRLKWASLTLPSLKRKLAQAPLAPTNGELCGTGYQHIDNYTDFVGRISDLRTDEAYQFLIDQAKKLSKHQSVKNSAKLVVLASALATRDTDDALDVINTLIKQQQLDTPAVNLISPAGMLSINPTVQLLDNLARRGQAKYDGVFWKFCHSSDLEVRKKAYSILLHKGHGKKLFDVGLESLDALRQHFLSAAKENKKTAAKADLFAMGSMLSMLDSPVVQRLFKKRLGEPEYALESAGYFSAHPQKHPTDTLRTALEIIPAKFYARKPVKLELIKRKDPAQLADAYQRLRQRYKALIPTFQKGQAKQLNYQLYNGWLVYIEPDIQHLLTMPATVEHGLKLLDSDREETKMIGMMIVYTADKPLITDAVKKQLQTIAKESDADAKRIIEAIIANK